MRYFSSLGAARPLALLLLLLPLLSQAQAPAFNQALTCASGDGYYGWGPQQLAVDAQGTRYVAGTYNGTITLGPSTLSATQAAPGYSVARDNFVAKLTAAGTYLWAVQMGDAQSAGIGGIAVDGAGDVYVTGFFTSYSIRLGGIGGLMLYNSSALGEGFVAKLNGTTGQWLWAQRIGGTGTDNLGALAVDAIGDIYLTGNSGSATADVGPFTLTGPQNFLAKLSPTGSWRWVREVGNNLATIARLQLDGQGGIYLAGTFQGPSVTFGTTMLTTQPVVGAPLATKGYDLFVAKTNDAGTWFWAVQGDAVTHQNLATLAFMTVDRQRHIYITGFYTNTSMRIGSVVLPNLSTMNPQPNPPPSGPYTNNYKSDAFVARLDATTGTWDWAIRNGGSDSENSGLSATDAQGRVYLAGTFSNLTSNGVGGNFAQIDGATGNWRSLQPLLYPFTALTLDGTSQPLLTGYFDTPTAQFGATTLTRVGTGSTGYIARMGAGPLAVGSAAQPVAGLQVWPNPSAGQGVWVQGIEAGQAVEVLDVLGQVVGRSRMPGSGPLWLGSVAGLTPGVYVVRGGGQARRLVIER